MNQTALPEVLTPEEVSTYLRLPIDIVLRQAAKGSLLGRKIEESWRFLKAAIDIWLTTQGSKSILLQQAGALADDPSLTELRATLYQNRGRAEAEEL